MKKQKPKMNRIAQSWLDAIKAIDAEGTLSRMAKDFMEIGNLAGNHKSAADRVTARQRQRARGGRHMFKQMRQEGE